MPTSKVIGKSCHLEAFGLAISLLQTQMMCGCAEEICLDVNKVVSNCGIVGLDTNDGCVRTPKERTSLPLLCRGSCRSLSCDNINPFNNKIIEYLNHFLLRVILIQRGALHTLKREGVIHTSNSTCTRSGENT